MSRPLRLEHCGAVWHVTSRGNERREVYHDDPDRERWLGLLGKVVGLFDWLSHGYVLMGNHYHLVVETPVPTLSRGMRHLNGVYTQAFNRRHQRVGHLFQGRFSAILVEKESHLLEVLRYVVLNPVRAGLVASPRDWAWSSYRATAAEAPAPPWLETAWSLAQFGGSEQRYREFVRPRRTGWKSFCASSSRALATTEGELAGHPRKRARERAILAYALRRFAGATGPAIAGVLGVSAWHASALARAGEGHWTGDIRLAARVEGAVGRT